jgi:hypothetical protein
MWGRAVNGAGIIFTFDTGGEVKNRAQFELKNVGDQA